MKMYFLALLALAMSSPAFASATITSGKLVDYKTVELEVSYGGGCAVHKFSLAFGSCLESLPAIMNATLVETTDEPDYCEALVGDTIQLDISKMKYCTPATLIIESGKSKISIQVPKFPKADKKPTKNGASTPTIDDSNSDGTKAASAL